MDLSRMLFAILAVAVVGPLPSASAAWMCWTADGENLIQCAQRDGTGQVDLLATAGKPQGIILDTINGKLYWAEHEPERIMVVDLEGVTNANVLVELGIGAGLRGIAVAGSLGKVYWVAEEVGKIQRANLDGSQVEDLPVGLGSFMDVVVDETGGMLYWTNGDQIWRGNLDGTSGAPIISDNTTPYYLALDIGAGHIYWTDFDANTIGRANLDGTQRVVPPPIQGLASRPIGLVLDLGEGKVYWVLESGAVQRADLDGGNLETVTDAMESTWDIALLPSLPIVGAVPAVSSWGFVVFALMLLCAGTILFGGKRRGELDVA